MGWTHGGLAHLRRWSGIAKLLAAQVWHHALLQLTQPAERGGSLCARDVPRAACPLCCMPLWGPPRHTGHLVGCTTLTTTLDTWWEESAACVTTCNGAQNRLRRTWTGVKSWNTTMLHKSGKGQTHTHTLCKLKSETKSETKSGYFKKQHRLWELAVTGKWSWKIYTLVFVKYKSRGLSFIYSNLIWSIEQIIPTNTSPGPGMEPWVTKAISVSDLSV